MKIKTLFKLNYKVKGIVLAIMNSFTNDNHSYAKYLCYSEDNKLFIIAEEIITYPEDEELENCTITSYCISEILSDNTIIPEFDNLLKNDNIYYLGIDLK